MFQQFYDNNIEAKFIKNILHTVHIPTVQIWRKGKPIIEGFTYITSEYIAKAIKDWPNEDNEEPSSIFDTRYFKIIEPYVEGDFYPGITSNFTSKTSYYDPETHKYLGEYLRLIRDLNGVDLMEWYNCWAGTYNDKIRFKSGNFTDLGVSQNDGNQVYIVPIKFNQKYTIYFNSNMPIYIQPCYYNSNTNKLEAPYTNLGSFNASVYNSCSFNNPILHEGVYVKGTKVVGASTSRLLEDYLTLLIQTPKNNSPLIVLEGDYSNVNVLLNKDNKPNRIRDLVYGEDDINSLDDYDLNKSLKSISSLTRCLDGKSYAFNDRLLEYLLNNPITRNDPYGDDIERIQNRVSSFNFKSAFGDKFKQDSLHGVWDNNLRKFIYDTMLSKKYPSFIDINGFVDKNAEVSLMGDNNG